MGGRTGEKVRVNGSIRPLLRAAAGTLERWRVGNVGSSLSLALSLLAMLCIWSISAAAVSTGRANSAPWCSYAANEPKSSGDSYFEHLVNLEQLPPSGFTFTAAPPKIKGAGTVTVRAFASV